MGKKFRAMRLQATFSTASAISGSSSPCLETSAFGRKADIFVVDVRSIEAAMKSDARLDKGELDGAVVNASPLSLLGLYLLSMPVNYWEPRSRPTLLGPS